MSEPNTGELLRVIERENVITYKRKTDQKSNYKSQTDDEVESAPSLKASSNPPLPELQKDKRKLVIRAFGSLQPKTGNFVQKEVRQHENILLKQRNNMLSGENLKLKTRIAVLQKQNERLQKIMDNEHSQMKPSTAFTNSRERMRPVDNTLRAVIRGLRKEVEDMKKQNIGIKSAVKFTSLKELQAERDHLAEETIRLRLTLQEQYQKKSSMRVNHQGVNALQHKLHTLSQRNSQLNKDYLRMVQQNKKLQENASKVSKIIQNQKTLTKALASARKTINQKDLQIQHIKGLLKTATHLPSSNTILPVKQNKIDFKRTSIDNKNKMQLAAITKETGAKSVPKSGVSGSNHCEKCAKLERQNNQLLTKCAKLQQDLQKLQKVQFGDMPNGPIQPIKEEQVTQLRRFLLLRFKAHRLSHEQSQKYLINCQGVMTAQQLIKQMSIRELMQSLFVQPFCIVSNRYLQVLIACLVYGQKSQTIKIEQDRKVSKKSLIEAYCRLLPAYQIMNQQRQEEMFIQVAELITTYYQQILAALTAKRNGEGTICQNFFLQFFKEIELEQEYIDFIITQIILESLDMEHLNFYAMFQIFYMPQMTAPAGSNPNMKKKKFEVEHQQVVHEQDEEYEESKSHLGSRNVTLEQKQEDDDDNYQWQQQSDKKKEEMKAKESPLIVKQTQKKQEKPNQSKIDEQQHYAQEYEQQKVSHQGSQGKVAEYQIQDQFQK